LALFAFPPVQLQDAMAFFQKLDGGKREEREQALQSYRQKAQKGLAGFLEETLTAGQQTRFRQLQLQHDGAFALGNPTIGAELKLTDEQRKQFELLVRDMQ